MYREINVWYTPLQSVFQVTLSSLSAVLFHCPVFVAPASGLNFHSPSDVPVSQISLLSRSVTGTDLKCRPVLAPNIYQYNYQWLTNIHTISHTHTHPFNGTFSGTTRVSRYQKGKTNLDITEARDSEWQWHQLGHMQVCTLLQTDNHASNPPLSFFTGRMPFLPPNQQRQSTEGIALKLSSATHTKYKYEKTKK